MRKAMGKHWRWRRTKLAMSAMVSGVLVMPTAALAQMPSSQDAIAWSFEESAQTTSPAPDFTTQFDEPDFVPGVSGRAWRSDGFSSSVSAPLSLAANQGFTVQGWVALESYPSADEVSVDKQVTASLFQQASENSGFDVFIDAYGRWGARVSASSGTQRVQVDDRFPLNRWVHVAMTFDPGTGALKLFRDGVLVGERAGRPGQLKPAKTDFRIARSWQDAPFGVFNINGLSAAYDDVRVVRRALAGSEVAASIANVTPPDARASLIVPASRFASDLQRPRYHAMPPANWTNEPHGLVRRGNTWHMFYQRTPNGPFKTLMTWGHMKSDDLVHWTDLPIALRPELQTDDFGYDMKGIWSGDVVTAPGDTAFAFYTSVNHSADFYNPGISLAISEDPDMIKWKKAGPLIDRTGVTDFRDPYVWFEDGETRMIVGAAMGNGGGLAYYRCDDLGNRKCWKRQPLIAPFGKMDIGSEIWEMPVLEAIGNGKHILKVNPIGGKVTKYGDPSTRGVYWIGKWDGTRFTPDNLRPKMLDLLPGHLSPTVARDASGQLVGIGIVDERRTTEAQLKAGWAHTFSLPRLWRLMPDNQTLGQSPLPTLAELREPGSEIARAVRGQGTTMVGDLGRAVEIKARFDAAPDTGTYGLTIATSPDGSETTTLYYDVDRKQVVLDKRRSTLGKDSEGPDVLRGAYDVVAFGKPREFHVYIDHSVVDVFINGAAAFSFRIYPTLPGSSGFGVTSSAPVDAQVEAWRMKAAPIR